MTKLVKNVNRICNIRGGSADVCDRMGRLLMNREELRAYIALTHQVKPESYRVSEDGTKLYVVEHRILVCLEGENLDEMSPNELYEWHLPKLRDWKERNLWGLTNM